MQTSTSTGKLPKPEKTRAYLVSEGFPTSPTFTIHHYYETRLLETADDGNEYEFIFACFKTGALRRWGTCFVDKPTTLASEDAN